jgi:uncharacterized radical SAM superfamily Fe-S cluster-containing enzyme
MPVQSVRSELCPLRVQSLCPVCGRVAAGEYVTRGGGAQSGGSAGQGGGGSVYFEIECPEHGVFSTLASEDPAMFAEYMSKPSVTVAPREALTKGAFSARRGDEPAATGGDAGEARLSAAGGERGGVPRGECPLHCGVCEDHLMTACCVLLDVTTRCDQHCPWCFASAGSSDGDPSLEEIARWYDRLVRLGEARPFNIQLSGGEPTVRDDLPEIVALGRAKGFTYLQLNTNGRRLGASSSPAPAPDAGSEADLADPARGENSARASSYGGGETGEAYARRLAEAGVSTVFLQFDGMSDTVYGKLRGEPLLEMKLRAIENCAKAGLPVTLVPTIVKGVNIFESSGAGDGAGNDDAGVPPPPRQRRGTGEIGKMIDFMLANLGVVKGIHFQPASFFGRHENGPDRATMFAVMDEIERQTGGRLKKADLLPITTGHPLCCFCANYLREPDGSLKSMASSAQREGGMACCDEANGSAVDASCRGAPAPDPLEIIRRDRDFVLNKWTVGARSPSGRETAQSGEPSAEIANGAHDANGPDAAQTDVIMSFDEALDWFRGNMFTLSGMAFMDRSNLDAERLKRCRVHYYTPDDRLIPFCAYNAMYRGGA